MWSRSAYVTHIIQNGFDEGSILKGVESTMKLIKVEEKKNHMKFKEISTSSNLPDIILTPPLSIQSKKKLIFLGFEVA